MREDVISQWPLVSRLLDEATALPPEARKAWLDALPPEHATLRPILLRLLSHEARAAEFFAELPRAAAPPSSHATLASTHGGRPRTADARESTSHKAGDTVGPYRLVRELGHGGMGTVWLAERIEASAKIPVALKLPSLEGRRPQIAERFEREREILAALNHPNIARLHEAGVTADGQPYLALEYVEGESLPDYCNRRGLSARQRLELFLQVLRAVIYAHANLVIHRDLKPSNIIVAATGDVKLLDFGIAKLVDRESGSTPGTELTRLHGQIMTLEYASPEQVRGEPLTTATDVYSLGVVLFELLTGTRPYRLKRGSKAELEEAILAGDTSRPSQSVTQPFAEALKVPVVRWRRSLKGDLDTIVMKALEKDLNARYPTVSALAQDCERFLHDLPVLAVSQRPLYRFSRFVARHRLALGSASLIVFALLIGSGIAIWQARVALEQSRVASEEARKQQAVQSFLTALFDKNTRLQPDAARARSMTVRQLLLEAADRVTQELGETPSVKLELLNTVARLLRDIDEYERALELTNLAVTLAREHDLAESDAYVEALMGSALASRLLGRAEEALAMRDESLRVLDARGDHTSLLRARASANTIAQFSPDKEREIALVDEAVQLFETRYPEDQLHFLSLYYLGNLHRTQGRPREAADYFRRAIGVFGQVGSRDYTNLGASYGFLGECEFWLGHIGNAIGSYEKGLEILDRHAGSSSLITRFHRTHYAQGLHHAGRLNESRAAFDLVRNSTPPGPPSIVDFDGAIYSASGLVERGLAREAQATLEHFSDSWVEMGKRFVPNGRRWIVGLAFAQAMQGRSADAQRTLSRIGELPQQFYGEDFTHSPEYVADVAWIAMANGDVDAAWQLVQSVSDAWRQMPESFSWSFVRLSTHAAEIAARRGDGAESLRFADNALEHLRTHADPNGFPFLEARALKVRGEALLAGDRAAEAIESFNAARAIMQRLHTAQSPWLLDTTLALSAAHRRSGNESLANELAREGRSMAQLNSSMAATFLTHLSR